MILVTTPTGNTGSLILHPLVEGGHAGTISGLHRAGDMLATSGSAMRVLHCPNFYEELLWHIQAIAQTGMFFIAILGDAKYPEVAIKDIAAPAVKWLTDPNWKGVQSVGGIGPEDRNSDETAQMLSDALGKPSAFSRFPERIISNTCLALASLNRWCSP